MGCFQSKVTRQYPGHEDPIVLASQTAFSVSEVEALFELFKSISSSVIDEAATAGMDRSPLVLQLEAMGFVQAICFPYPWLK
ncbi:hypothetical protein HRI_001429600 [Hibiscus trionum]|uniref:Calcineurin B-like protein n=1 Tax=Hibiscus trionum TaxID=183268 RepID=A0A9W7HIR2_HIBTR|nr:hypothetical protein HRI_001429600 [Hibiscus trionum]